MSFIDHDREPRTLYISKAGNDKADGNESPICLQTFEELTSRIAGLVPPPSQTDQAAAISLARGRYDPTDTIEFSEWCQVNMPTVTVADGAITAATPTYKAASTSGVIIQGVTAIGANRAAYSFDATSRSGIEADAITCLNGGNAVEIINGAAGSFMEIGQCISDGVNVYIDTNGDRPSICNINVVDIVANGATGYYVNVADGIPCFMNGNGVRFAESPFGGGKPTTGTALQIVSGDTISYNYQLSEGDMILGDAKATIEVQHHKDGNITATDGDYYLQIQILEGDLTATSAKIVLNTQEQTGNVLINGTGPQSSLYYQLLTGNLELNAGINQAKIDQIIGNITIAGGTNAAVVNQIGGNLSVSGNSFNTIQLETIAGNVDFSGGTSWVDAKALFGSLTISSPSAVRLDIDTVQNDLTINTGANVKGEIFEVGGNITIAGIFNGFIDGIYYGSWVEGQEVAFTGLRNGTIQGSYDDACLVFTIDTTTDTIDEIIVGYKQTNVNFREVNFRVVSQDGSTTYFEDTIGTNGIGQQAEALNLTPVTALPTNQVVTLVVQSERQTGGQTTDANCQVNITRV